MVFLGFIGGLLILALCGIYATVCVLLWHAEKMPRGLVLSSLAVFILATLDTLLRGFEGVTGNLALEPYSMFLGGLKAMPMLWFAAAFYLWLRDKETE